MVRVRFAPSPTGHLHIGGARTALFNWLFSRNNKGKFLLRIEDTDVERSSREFINEILDDMKWLGLTWDEGPYFQSERLSLYREHADRLLRENKAYPCYCTPEELEQRRMTQIKQGKKPMYDGRCREARRGDPSRNPAIRFKSPREGATVIDDNIKGRITFDNRELDDLIILRADGRPTYNFSVVVDDVTMEITHVIRGDDHLNNTPRQILLYQAFGYPTPQFAHAPLIFGADKVKLSKRHDATSVREFREDGYLPHAIVNYLSRLGWSYGDQEIFSIDELIEKFDLSRVGSSSSVLNPEKLLWLNSHYIRNETPERMFELVRPFLERLGHKVEKEEKFLRLLSSISERSRTLKEMAEMSGFYFRDELEYDPDGKRKFFTEKSLLLLKEIRSELGNLAHFSQKEIEGAFMRFVEMKGIKLGDVAQPVRLAVTGRTVSPGIFEILEILGKEKVMRRLDRTIRSIEKA